jgi:hypothetical protein
VKTIALVVEVFEFHGIQNRPVHEFLRAKPVVDHGSRPQVFQARLHGPPFVARRTVIDAKYREELPFMLDHHAGTKLCRFCAAHVFCEPGRRARPLPIASVEFRKFLQAAR